MPTGKPDPEPPPLPATSPPPSGEAVTIALGSSSTEDAKRAGKVPAPAALANRQKVAAAAAPVSPPPVPKEAAPTLTDGTPSVASRVEDFLAKAAPILAVERGINAKSRVKLAAIAYEIGLSDADFEAALVALQSRDKSSPPALSPEQAEQLKKARRKFHNYAGQTLAHLPQGILTASMESMLLESGQQQFGLSADDSQAEVRDLSRKLRVRRISHEEAVRHVTEVIDARLATGSSIDKAFKTRLLTEASRWGLTPDQVDPLIKARASQRFQGERRKQFFTVLLISSAAALLVGVVICVVWISLSNSIPPPVDVKDPHVDLAAAGVHREGASSVGGGHVKPSAYAVPSWWNADMAAHVVRLRLKLPASTDALAKLRSPSDAERQAAYRELFSLLKKSDVDDQTLALFGGIFAGGYALDPSDEAAAVVREGLMQIAAGPIDALPSGPRTYELGLWAAETAATILMDSDVNADRASGLLASVDRTLQISLDRSAPPLALHRTIMAGEAAQLYRALTAAASSNADQAAGLHAALARMADGFLDAAAHERLSTDYLMAVLPELPDNWQQYEQLLRVCAQSDDPLNVLKILDFYERNEVAGLRSLLEAQLVLRASLPIRPRTPEELAADVRSALGAAALATPIDSRERYRRWKTLVDKSLAATPANDLNELLSQVVELSHLATLGAAISEQELGAGHFDVIYREGPKKIEATKEIGRAASAPSVTSRSSTVERTLARSTSTLATHRRLSKIERLNLLRNIASIAEMSGATDTDLRPEQATAIAGYLAVAKPVDEHVAVMDVVDPILKWHSVKLALADELESTHLRLEHVAELLSKLLGREIKLSGDEPDWRGTMRREVLAQVLADLPGAELKALPDAVAQRAALAVLERYGQQAKMLGVSAAAVEGATQPSAVLPAVIEARRTRLNARTLRPADKQFLKALPQELAVANYLSESDLSRTVRQQRLLVRLLAAEAGERNPTRQAAADALVSQLAAADLKADNLFAQLREGEATQLRLWQLICQP